MNDGDKATSIFYVATHEIGMFLLNFHFDKELNTRVWVWYEKFLVLECHYKIKSHGLRSYKIIHLI